MLIGSGILYVCFAESTLQKWNDYSSHRDDKELQALNKENKLIETILEQHVALKTETDAKEKDKESDQTKTEDSLQTKA